MAPDLQTSSARRRARILWWAQAAALVLAAVFAFSPAFRGGWIWDDESEVTRNAALGTARGLRGIWFAPAGLDYYPLKDTVQCLQWQLWGRSVLGYHLTNAGLHVLSGFLLWRLFRRLGIPLAWLGAMAFVVHPLTVGSVAWISELKNTLSLPFLLLSFDAWLGFCGDPSPADGGRARFSRRHYIFALAWFAAAMLCKSSVVMLPCVLLLHAWWRKGRIARADLAATAPFFLVSLVLGLVTVRFQQARALEGLSVPMGGFLWRAAVAGRAAVFYLGKCAWPADLLPVYPRWPVTPPAFVQFLPLAGLGAAAAVLWANRRSWGRHALFGLGSFLLFLAPVLGFVRMSYFRFSFVSDHLVYLPLAALAGLAAAGFSSASARAPRAMRPWVAAALGAACALLAVQSRRHAAIFRGAEALWSRTLECNPQAWVAHNNLATALATRPGRQAEAVVHYEAAIRLNPDYAEAHNNLGFMLAGIPGRQADAIAHCETALRLRPGLAGAHNNLALILVKIPGRLPDAIAHYEAAIRLNPDYAGAHNNLALVLAAIPGRQADAIAHYGAAIRLQPDFAVAHYNLAILLEDMGRRPDAIAQYRAAIRLQPDFAEAHDNLGIALGRDGRLAEAAGEFREALRINPGLVDAHHNLGLALRAGGRISEADAEFEAAERLRAAPAGTAR